MTFIRNNKLNTILLMLVLVPLIFASTGCSYLMYDRIYNGLEEYVDGFIEDAEKEPIKTLNANSSKRIKVSKLSDEQQDIFDDTFSLKFKIDYLTLDDGNYTATCKMKVTYTDITAEFDNELHTVDEYVKLIEDLDTKTKTMTFTLTRTGKEWSFDDLSEIYTVAQKPYGSLFVCDDEGYPLSLSQDYFDTIYIQPLWYDPLYSTPLHLNKLEDPCALQCAFYFNTPVNLKLKADLKDANGKVIASRDLDINNSVIAIADFSCEYVGVDRFAQGNYTVELIYDGEVFAKTDDPLTVR